MNKDIDRYRAIYRNARIKKKKLPLYLFPWSPLFPLFVHRFGFKIDEKWANKPSKNLIRNALRILYHMGRYLSVVFRKTEIEGNAVIEEGVFLSPRGGIVLGPRTMGPGCVVHHNVTIGYGFGSGKEMERPNIAENVWIGANVVIYGNITIGAGAIICPNTVVNKNIPQRSIVKGNPAKIIRKRNENHPLLYNVHPEKGKLGKDPGWTLFFNSTDIAEKLIVKGA